MPRKIICLCILFLLVIPIHVYAQEDTRAVITPENAAELTEVYVMEGHTHSIGAVTFSPDGKFLASTDCDEYITGGCTKSVLRLWDVENIQAEPTLLIEDYPGGLTGVQFSPDGQWIGVGGCWQVANYRCQAGSLRVIDLATGEMVLHADEAHDDVVYRVAFSADSTEIVSAGQEGTTILWDVASGTELVRLEDVRRRASMGVAIAPDGATIATTLTRFIRIMDTATGEEVARWEGSAEFVFDLAYSADGTKLVAGSESAVVVFDTATGEEIARFEGHTELINDVEINAAGTLLATSSEDDTVRVWDIATGTELAVLAGHTNTATGVAFSPDGTWLVTSTDTGIVRWWAVPN